MISPVNRYFPVSGSFDNPAGFATYLAISAPLTIVFSKATLSKINFEVEKTKKEISEQTKTNESLSMKINELASLDKIEEVAKEQGLSYNNDNIKNIDE